MCLQDWQRLFDPGNDTKGQMPAVQILWDVFTYRFGSGMGALVVLTIPFIALHGSVICTITAASRYAVHSLLPLALRAV